MIEPWTRASNWHRLVGKFWYWWMVAGALLSALVGLILLSHGLVHGVRDNKILGAFALAGALLMWLMALVHLYVYPRLIAFIERMERRRASKKASSVF